jgi:DHA1 family bicyclomycin/chloramphenicol resistance-like MFS transporter
MTAMTIDINLPAIPETARDLGSSLATAQLMVPVFFLGFAVGQLVWGPVSDRFGRKPSMLAGTTVYVLSSLACALVADMPSLLLWRGIEGFGAGAGSVLGRAVVRDLFSGPEMARILSLALAAFLIAPIAAPTLGALILSLASWRWIFGFLVIYGLVVLAATAFFLEESLRVRNPAALRPGPMLTGFVAVFRDPTSRTPALVAILAFGLLVTYIVNAAAVFMAGFGFGPTGFGLLFGAVALFMVVGTVLNSRLVHRLPLSVLLHRGLQAALVASLASLLVAATGWGGAWALTVTIGVLFLVFGLIGTNAVALAMQPHGQIVGVASSALGFAQAVVPAAVASLVAFLHELDPTARPMALAWVILSAASLALLSRYRARGG